MRTESLTRIYFWPLFFGFIFWFPFDSDCALQDKWMSDGFCVKKNANIIFWTRISRISRIISPCLLVYLSTRLLVNSSTSKKLRLCRKERWLCREYSYEILSVYLCCTVGAPMLHLWCQGAALLLALLFVSLYSGFSVGQIRQISWSSDYNSYANICFFRTRIARIWRIFLGCDMIYIRGIREICGQLNIIHTRICFSNTNRTNLTNLVGCDMVCIRGIREIRGQTNKIHTRIYIFFEH